MTENNAKDPFVGTRQGMLYVERIVLNHEHKTHRVYFCRCDCGEPRQLGFNRLRSGTRSCGCLSVKQTRVRRKREPDKHQLMFNRRPALKE